MTDSERLTIIGQAIYGRSWQSQIADDLLVDRRSVNHWLNGTRTMPNGIWLELNELALKRIKQIENIVL